MVLWCGKKASSSNSVMKQFSLSVVARIDGMKPLFWAVVVQQLRLWVINQKVRDSNPSTTQLPLLTLSASGVLYHG